MRALLTVAWLAVAAFLTWHAVAYKAPAIEQDIATRAQQAVKAHNPAAQATVYGRFIVVRGQAPDEAARVATLEAANEVWGGLGPYDEIVVSAHKEAAIVAAEKALDGSLRLSGTVPSDDVQALIEKAAKTAFSGAIDNRLTVADTEAVTVQGIDDAFKALAGLDAGTLLVNSKRVTVSGDVSDPARAAAVREITAAHPDGWQLFVNAPQPARFSAVKLPDGTVVASGDVATEDARAALLETFQDGEPDRGIVDRMNVRASGMPETWTANSMRAAKALVELDWGSISLDGPRSYLAGMAGPDEINRISDNLGSDFTAELTPRPSDRTLGRLSGLERELRSAKSRILDLSAAAAKHLADLDAAEAKISELQKAGAGDTDGEKVASRKITELETAIARSKGELDSANARIAGLTEMLSLQPADMSPPADALPAPAQSSLRPPADEQTTAPQPEMTGTTTPPDEPQDAEPPTPLAQETPSAAAPEPQPEPPLQTAALQPPQDAASVATSCNSAIGAVLGSASISFESKSAQITREGNDVLDRLIAETTPCIGNPALKVTVGGHTDSRGQDRDNLRLSKERADSVKESLIVRSIPPDAITAIGYGETMPVADNDTDEGRAANRRITIDWSLR